MHATVIDHSSASEQGQSSANSSRAKVRFVAGHRAHFSDETAALLRSRLLAAAMVISLILTATFVTNIFRGITTLYWLRGFVVLSTIGVAILLRVRSSLSLFQLRLIELLVFGLALFQLSLMLHARLDEFARKGDLVSMASLRQQFLMAWCIVIFLYGTLIPNSWRRGAIVTIPGAILPYALLGLESLLSPDVATLLSTDHARSPLPIPLAVACIAIFTTHVINSVRRDAFKAHQFGQYRLMEKLGAGGMGEVYRAEHLLLKRPCAIKLIKTGSELDSSVIARFEREVKSTAKLTHWNTVEIFDYGRTDDGTFYYVMELLPGLSLEDLVKQHGPLSPERVVHLLHQICGALHEAHSMGLIHRDIKPANIFASQRGGVFDVAKLLDFGLVKEDQTKVQSGSAQGSFSGTPLYMAPEQALSYNEVDRRADLYSLGAVAYFLLTGQPPFTGSSVVELLLAHRNSKVTPPSRLNPRVPAEVEQIVLRCLAKQPAERFTDAAALQIAFENCQQPAKWSAEQAKEWWQSINIEPQDSSKIDTDVDATIISASIETDKEI